MEEQNNYFTYGQTPKGLSGDQNTGFFDSLINGLFDTGGGLEDNVFSRWLHPEIAEQKEFERENYMVDKANAFNEYMYEKALKDNSPAAQMERAREAGINLNLAAGGIMGGGNAVATPMQGAQGNLGMNNSAQSPFSMLGDITEALGKGVSGANELGEMLGYGQKNKAEIKQINATADKAAEEADFTYWQKRQFRKLMNVTIDHAYKNLEETEANINALKAQIDVFKQQKWNIAADTNLKEAQTGEVLQDTKNKWYEEQKLAFEKIFRDLYGVEITESGLNMLVQACLAGKGDIIVGALSDGIAKMIRQAKKGFEENIGEILNPLSNETTEKIIDAWNKDKEQLKKRWGDFTTFAKNAIKRGLKWATQTYDAQGHKIK